MYIYHQFNNKYLQDFIAEIIPVLHVFSISFLMFDFHLFDLINKVNVNIKNILYI